MPNFPPISKIPTQNVQFDVDLGKLKKAASDLKKKDVEDKKLMEASKDFESLMTFMMLKNMRSSVIKSDLLKSPAEDIYQSMLDQEITKNAAKNKGLGIAEMVYGQFSKNGPEFEGNSDSEGSVLQVHQK